MAAAASCQHYARAAASLASMPNTSSAKAHAAIAAVGESYLTAKDPTGNHESTARHIKALMNMPGQPARGPTCNLCLHSNCCQTYRSHLNPNPTLTCVSSFAGSLSRRPALGNSGS